MLGLHQFALLNQAGKGARGQFLLPPEEFDHVALLRRANRIEIEFHKLRACFSFTNKAVKAKISIAVAEKMISASDTILSAMKMSVPMSEAAVEVSQMIISE